MKSIWSLFDSYVVELDDVKQLIGGGADLLDRNKYGDTLLMRAVDSGNLDIARFFIAKGIDVTSKNKSGSTALHCAGYRGYDTIIPDLLAAGAGLDATEGTGNTPLMRTVIQNKVSTAKILLDTGADVDIQDNQGLTFLMKAVYSRQPEMVKLAIQAGAKDLQEKSGHTALMMAFKERMTNNPDLDLSIAKMLVEHDIDINATNKHGETPLIIAILAGSVDGVSILLDAGAALDLKNDIGQTALDIAVDKNSWYPNPVYKAIIEKLEYHKRIRADKASDRYYDCSDLSI